MIIRVEANGTVLLLHNTKTVRAINAVLNGTVEIRRASHVEPLNVDPHGESNKYEPKWNVDLRPVGGPGSLTPLFYTREEALNAETHWIETNILAYRPPTA